MGDSDQMAVAPAHARKTSRSGRSRSPRWLPRGHGIPEPSRLATTKSTSDMASEGPETTAWGSRAALSTRTRLRPSCVLVIPRPSSMDLDAESPEMSRWPPQAPPRDDHTEDTGHRTQAGRPGVEFGFASCSLGAGSGCGSASPTKGSDAMPSTGSGAALCRSPRRASQPALTTNLWATKRFVSSMIAREWLAEKFLRK